MSTRQRVENIIIGTLLDLGDHYDDCRGYVTEDMFRDETNRRIYGLITKMKDEGYKHTDPASIFERFGEAVLDIVARMCELCNEFSFECRKIRYNEKISIYNSLNGTNYPIANVEFIDYIRSFINSQIEDEKRSR